MDFDKEKDLLKRFTEGTCSDEEKEQVESWYLQEIDKSEPPLVTENELQRSKYNIWNKFLLKKHPTAYNTKKYLGYVAAASFLLICGLGLYLHQKPFNQQANSTILVNKAIEPGGNRATLTLADGTKIDLTEAENGVIASQSNATIKKTKEGLLIYEASNDLAQNATEQLVNTIDIPKGGQYKLVLPDGTKVWLNSMTSIKYPSSFSGSERRVELKGEAYFEVAKNKHMNFIVQTSKMEVEVLGTHFNVMSYDNEAYQETALLEGSVKVKQKSTGSIKTLKPGYLVSINDENDQVSLKEANVESIIAWKNGIFQFDKEDIKTIMKKLERWYDIEVVYEGEITTDQFVGKISKKTNLDDVLKILSQSKIKYRVQGKKIIFSS